MQYRVKVKVMAEVEYEAMIDADSFTRAEKDATAEWRSRLPEDFQVDKGYVTEIESDAEQLTWECQECGRGITEEVSDRCDEMCEACFKAASRLH